MNLFEGGSRMKEYREANISELTYFNLSYYSCINVCICVHDTNYSTLDSVHDHVFIEIVNEEEGANMPLRCIKKLQSSKGGPISSVSEPVPQPAWWCCITGTGLFLRCWFQKAGSLCESTHSCGIIPHT